MIIQSNIFLLNFTATAVNCIFAKIHFNAEKFSFVQGY